MILFSASASERKSRHGRKLEQLKLNELCNLFSVGGHRQKIGAWTAANRCKPEIKDL